MIYTVTLTPALDKTVVIPGFTIGKVNRIREMRLDPGGKGINVSKTIRALGGESVACGILGGDNGRYILAQLEQQGISRDFIMTESNTRTNLKVIDPENHTNTDINEPGAPVDEYVLQQVLNRLKKRITPGDTVVLAGKAPAGTDSSIFARWTEELRTAGAKVCIDCDGELLAAAVEAKPDLIKPNDDELGQLIGKKFGNAEEILQAARQLVSRGIGTVAVSMGGEGAIFVNGNAAYRGYGLKVPVQSTVGAGDATMAALCFGQSQNLPFEKTCRLAIAAGAAAVTMSGSQSIEKETVDSLEKMVKIRQYL